MTGVEVGDTATFTRDSGYGIVGDDSLICGSDGAWSNDAPLCLREYHVIHGIDFNIACIWHVHMHCTTPLQFSVPQCRFCLLFLF